MHNLVHRDAPLDHMVRLRMQTMHAKISRQELGAESRTTLPLMVSVEVEDNEALLQREALDLVLVVDVSGSMRGDKIQLVGKTLDLIIDELEDQDGLSVVLFNTAARVLCKSLPMTPANKAKTKTNLTKNLRAGGGTDIKKALEAGFGIYQRQKEHRGLAAMFLISDGHDNCGNKKKDFTACLRKFGLLKAKRRSPLRIHALGYGQGHDEHLLNMIAAQSRGSFYYVKTLKYIDECVIDCFGKLMSSFASDVALKVQLSAGIEFETVVSDVWTQRKKRAVVGKLGSLAIGKTRHFVFEVSVDASKARLEPGQILEVGAASLRFCVRDEPVEVGTTLALEVVETTAHKGELRLDVAQNYTKFQALKVMQRAKDTLRRGLEGRGKRVLEEFLAKMGADARLGKAFRSDLKSQLSLENLQNDKHFFQVQQILHNGVYNPDFQSEGAPQLNRRQRAMRTKRRQ